MALSSISIVRAEFHENRASLSESACEGDSICNKLPNIREIGNSRQFKKEFKDVLIKGCYCSIEDYLNEEFCNIDC
jgi:hypothetical protein